MSGEFDKGYELPQPSPVAFNHAFLRLYKTAIDKDDILGYIETRQRSLELQGNEHFFNLCMSMAQNIAAGKTEIDRKPTAGTAFLVGGLAAYNALDLQFKLPFVQLEHIEHRSRFPGSVTLAAMAEERVHHPLPKQQLDELLGSAEAALREHNEVFKIVEHYEDKLFPKDFTKLRAGAGFITGIILPAVQEAEIDQLTYTLTADLDLVNDAEAFQELFGEQP